jgi:hypothetical protein
MQAELAFDKAELGRSDQPAMGDADAVERALQISRPEIEKVSELGEARREIVILPDIALQKLRMVGKAIEDLGGGQREAFDLAEGSNPAGLSRIFGIIRNYKC